MKRIREESLNKSIYESEVEETKRKGDQVDGRMVWRTTEQSGGWEGSNRQYKLRVKWHMWGEVLSVG